MKTGMALIIIASLALGGACSSEESSEKTPRVDSPATASADVTTERLAEHVRYLASDELGGRAPGSTGEQMTLIYLTEQYARLGWRPGNSDGTYVQAVPLTGVSVTNHPSLIVESSSGRDEFYYGDDFVGWTFRRRETVDVDDAEMIFVGYGVVAPEYHWDDYKDTDVSGKMLVMFVGDPPLPDTTQFGGRAMTYYGRWTYKYEIAAEKGAAGAILVHKAEAAGYPWEVVGNSWAGEQFDVERGDDGMSRCAIEGWVSQRAATEIFESAGMSLSDAYRRALSRDFRPVPMEGTASVSIRNDLRSLRSYNVVALLEGQDEALKDEIVVYTAHWDHLGTSTPTEGDSIYNGALDNASGVAATLEIARLLSTRRAQLKRSILIINTTAEESGLLGAYHYVDDPIYPLSRTIAAINIDGLNVWGRTKDMVVIGYGMSELDDYLRAAIESQGRHLQPDSEPEKGYYYRSDHFPFAKKGIPSLYADSGVKHIARPPSWGLETRQQYTSERYHKPNDEYSESWDLSGAVEDVEALFRVGLMVASVDVWPQWREGSEFKRARRQSLDASR